MKLRTNALRFPMDEFIADEIDLCQCTKIQKSRTKG